MYPQEHHLQDFFSENPVAEETYMGAPLLSLIKQNPPSMPTTELSSLKWGEDGELSPNDILNLVEKLMQAEEESRRSDLNSSPIPRKEASEDS